MQHLKPFTARKRDDSHNAAITNGRFDRSTAFEVILVLLILGLLAVAVVIAVSGMRAQASDTSCVGDRQALELAVEDYFSASGNTTVPATGTGDDRFEQTLVRAGFLPAASVFHDIDADGVTTRDRQWRC
jgi:type II secretory pathway pseudopilin PulG